MIILLMLEPQNSLLLLNIVEVTPSFYLSYMIKLLLHLRRSTRQFASTYYIRIRHRSLQRFLKLFYLYLLYQFLSYRSNLAFSSQLASSLAIYFSLWKSILQIFSVWHGSKVFVWSLQHHGVVLNGFAGMQVRDIMNKSNNFLQKKWYRICK